MAHLPCSRFRGDSCTDIPRYCLVVRELHRVRGSTLGHAAQIGGVTEHFGERHLGAHDLRVAARLHTFYLASATVEIAHDVAQEIVGCGYFDLHHGFEDLGTGFSQRGLGRLRRRNLECHLIGVDLVIRAVDRGNLDVDHRIAGDHATFQRLADARLDRRRLLAWHGAADNLPLELDARTGRLWLGRELHVAVHASATGLTLEGFARLGWLGDRLAVGDLWPADIGIDAVLAHEAVDQHFQVQLTHASDDGLAGFGVAVDAERGILVHEFAERDAHLVLVRFCLWLDRDADDRLGEGDCLEDDGMRLVAQGVASDGALGADDGRDFTRLDFGNVLALVGVELDEPADSFALIAR